MNDWREKGPEDKWLFEKREQQTEWDGLHKVRDVFHYDNEKVTICNRYRDDSGTPRPLRDVETDETFWPGCGIEFSASKVGRVLEVLDATSSSSSCT